MTTTTELGSYAYNRISNIPTTISVGSVVEFINYGKIDVENWTGDTINIADVPTKYQNILISIGCMFTLTKMLGANADFDVDLGEFRLTKADKNSPEFRELQFYQTHINESMKVMLGTAVNSLFTKVYGV
jgi:hypothetical protein